MTERKYLPTLAELIDRHSIVLLKAVFLDKAAYKPELDLIEQDINTLINEWHGAGHNFTAYDLRMIMMIMLANRYIWENEAETRVHNALVEENKEMDLPPRASDHAYLAQRLRATHSINGVRNTAKNQLARVFGERQDKKIDCLAADLPKEFGSWDIFH